MKRTKRYGGFLVGDRVIPKNKSDYQCIGIVRVDRFENNRVVVRLNKPIYDPIREYTHYYATYSLKDLINLTMIEEQEVNARIKTQKAMQMLEEAKERQKKLSKIKKAVLELCFSERPITAIRFSPSDLPQDVEEL